VSRIGVGVVGLGVGRQHLEALSALADRYEIRAVCDLDEARLQAMAQRFGVVRAGTQLDDLLADERIELVHLCTPPHLHLPQILQVLAAGRHVVCEKPLVCSLAELDQVEAAAARAGRQVFPIFQSRFGHGLQQLLHLQACGYARHALVATVETHWRREADYYAAAWRGRWATERGGVCLTQAIHAHDILTRVLGPVRTVFAQLATRVNDIEVEDCAAISLVMADGSLASLSATLGAAENISRLKFVFDDLTALGDSPNPYRPALAPWHFQGKTAAIDAALRDTLRGCVPGRESFEHQFAAVHDTLRHGTPAPVTLQDARAALELVTAIYASAASGQAVSLPITPQHPGFKDWRPAAGGFPKSLGRSPSAAAPPSPSSGSCPPGSSPAA
jgi:predicted dehydrogenase